VGICLGLWQHHVPDNEHLTGDASRCVTEWTCACLWQHHVPDNKHLTGDASQCVTEWAYASVCGSTMSLTIST